MTLDRFSCIGANVWLGSQWSCDAYGDEFDRVLHVQSVGQEPPCKRKSRPADLFVTMTEKVCLGLTLIDQIAAFGRGTDRIFVHCAAGMCRGPTAATIVLVSRGYSVGAAMGAVTNGTCCYLVQPIMPWWEFAVMEEIRRWASERSVG